MIAKLFGLVDALFDGFIILNVSGVGYRVFCSARTIGRLPGVSQAVSLFIETQVREDHIHLFGFLDATEQQMFNFLTGVQGVGSKSALGILSVLQPNEIQMAVMTGDSKAFTRAPGVGPKLGVRIVTELKGKLGTLGSHETLNPGGLKSDTGSPLLSEAVSALINLGYSRTEAGICVARALQDHPDAALPDLIRFSLKEISKSGFPE